MAERVPCETELMVVSDALRAARERLRKILDFAGHLEPCEGCGGEMWTVRASEPMRGPWFEVRWFTEEGAIHVCPGGAP